MGGRREGVLFRCRARLRVSRAADLARRHVSRSRRQGRRLPDLRAGAELRRKRRLPLDGQRRRRVRPRQALCRMLLGVALRDLRPGRVRHPPAGRPRRGAGLRRLPVGQPLLHHPGPRRVPGARRHRALLRRRAPVPPARAAGRRQGAGGEPVQRAVLLRRAARLPQGGRHQLHDGLDDHRRSRPRRRGKVFQPRCAAPRSRSICGSSSTGTTTGGNSRSASRT